MRIVAVLSCRDQYFHPWLCQIMIQLRPICYKDLCSLLVWSITLSKHVKSPVYEFTDWKLPLVAFTHLIRNSFTTCRGSFNYLLMTETWKLYHVHYKRSIYTSQSTLPFIPLASLDSHMALGIDYRNTWPSTKGSDLFNKLWDMLWFSLGEEGASEDSEVHNKIKEKISPGQVQSWRHSISRMSVMKTMSWQ